jgi:hypothetical protein
MKLGVFNTLLNPSKLGKCSTTMMRCNKKSWRGSKCWRQTSMTRGYRSWYPVRIIVLILRPCKEMPGYYLILDHDSLGSHPFCLLLFTVKYWERYCLRYKQNGVKLRHVKWRWQYWLNEHSYKNIHLLIVDNTVGNTVTCLTWLLTWHSAPNKQVGKYMRFLWSDEMIAATIYCRMAVQHGDLCLIQKQIFCYIHISMLL